MAGGSTSLASGPSSTVGGGFFNIASGGNATVGGGFHNGASGNNATVGGGSNNGGSGDYATVPGGYFNAAVGVKSLAAGNQAKASLHGAFVWADSSVNSEFASTGSNQFLIRATGGVGIGKNEPSEALDVNGNVKATKFIGDGSLLTNLPGGGGGGVTQKRTPAPA